ncbi:GNAT family N-acetyltransferase [Agilicoccus flavus]|uniref:GNAT family N-acetyltransferase n=1 Tax=Agilicoccus flavus TaxID=2775968 RepID=UPI001CF6D875|nr:GNAT family N-acetyltransferase [Agilicoccus flavus]
MTDISVRVLAENEWEQYKEVRLRALQESPEAFVADHATEAAFDDEQWQARMRRSARLVAEADGKAIGIVSVRGEDDLFDDAAEIFGLWVAPDMRGAGAAAALVQAGAAQATGHGHRQLVYWVGTDNGRAVAFASSYGFRPTEYRRPMRVRTDEDGDQELAMVLALNR